MAKRAKIRKKARVESDDDTDYDYVADRKGNSERR